MEAHDLLSIFSNLGSEDFETFKWYLKNQSFLKNFQIFSKAQLEAAKRPTDLVDRMVETHGKNVTEVTGMILRAINRQDLLDMLQTFMSKSAGASGLNPPSSVTGDGQPRMDTVRVGHGGTQTSKKKYFYELTLDINSAHRYLKLSNNDRKAECVSEVIQPYPDHPDRFDIQCQVLCSTGLTGRCYWEVEWSGAVIIAVAYRGTNRKGNDGCVFGENAQSWGLWCSADGHSVRHNKIKSILPYSSPSSGRVAVFLDYSAGSLSFYKVSSADLIHLHTYNTTFTGPLYAGFWVESRSSVSLCDV